jgi:hypothetical protein
MSIVSHVKQFLQSLLGKEMDALAVETGCVKRRRQFTGATLLSMLVLTVLRNPKAKMSDYQATAAQLGVVVTESATAQRFTAELTKFLEATLPLVLKQVLSTKPPPVELLSRFPHVVIGDSTVVGLPDELAAQFPGCGGSYGSGKAALKLQVVHDLRHGTLRVLVEAGKASDAKSPITEMPWAKGSLLIFDLGYFSLERFAKLDAAGNYFISRLQSGTQVFDKGRAVDLPRFLRDNACDGVVDLPVQVGELRLSVRMVAFRAPKEVVALRRQKAREKARERGREPSAEHLALLEWTIYITNCGPELLSWKEVVVLYRARWQIERLFKLWKSLNHLADRDLSAPPHRQLAEVYIKLIAVVVQHNLLLLASWPDAGRSLWRVAKSLRNWIGQLIAALDSAEQLPHVLTRLQKALTKTTGVNRRTKRPSCFQLLNNPELLEYVIA